MAKQDIILDKETLKKKEQLDEQLGKNRLKLMNTVYCPECNKSGTISKTIINTAENIPLPLTGNDLPLGIYVIYKCKTKNCKFEKKVLINAEM